MGNNVQRPDESDQQQLELISHHTSNNNNINNNNNSVNNKNQNGISSSSSSSSVGSSVVASTTDTPQENHFRDISPNHIPPHHTRNNQQIQQFIDDSNNNNNTNNNGGGENGEHVKKHHHHHRKKKDNEEKNEKNENDDIERLIDGADGGDGDDDSSSSSSSSSDSDDDLLNSEYEFFQICLDHVMNYHSLQLNNKGYQVFPALLLQMIKIEYEKIFRQNFGANSTTTTTTTNAPQPTTTTKLKLFQSKTNAEQQKQQKQQKQQQKKKQQEMEPQWFISHLSLAFNSFVMFPYDSMIELKRMRVLRISEMDLTCAGLYHLNHIPKPVDSTDDDDTEYLNGEWALIFPQLTSFKAPGNHIQSFNHYLAKCKLLSEVDIGDNPCIGANEPFLPFVSDEALCRIESLRFLKISNCFNFLCHDYVSAIHEACHHDQSSDSSSSSGGGGGGDGDQHNLRLQYFDSDNENREYESLFHTKLNVELPESLLRLHCESLEILIASENNITRFCPSIGDPFVMSQLRELILNDNRIRVLNPAIFNGNCLPVLQTLVLMNNELEGALIEEIGTIKSLKRLYLGDNRLSSLPKSIGSLQQLECLDCHANRLSSLPSTLHLLRNMRYLDLTMNRIERIEPDVLRNLDRLTDLYLAGNLLTNETCSLGLIGKHMTRLKKLNICYNRFTSIDDFFTLSKTALSRLNRLLVSGNRLTHVPMQLATCHCLTHLHIGNNYIHEVPFELLDALSERIRVLSMFGNGIANDETSIQHIVSFGNGSIIDISHNNYDSNLLASFNDGHWIDIDFHYNLHMIDCELPRDESVSFGYSHMLGDRPTNEDSWYINNNMKFRSVPDLHVQMYAIFDGHGGDVCARYSSSVIASVLDNVFEQCASKLVRNGSASSSSSSSSSPPSSSASKFNVNMLDFGAMVIRMLIVQLDQRIREQHIMDGCTAVITLVLDNKYCICANVGDARGVLVSQQSTDHSILGQRITVDHKSSKYHERRRVMDLGGCTYEGRINGYSLSRALGDHDQRPLISCDPHVHSFVIDPSIHRYLILACDGVWDMVSDQRASELVHDTFVKLSTDVGIHESNVRRINSHAYEEGAKVAMCAAVLRDYAYALRSMDNISVIICKFNNNREKNWWGYEYDNYQ